MNNTITDTKYGKIEKAYRSEDLEDNRGRALKSLAKINKLKEASGSITKFVRDTSCLVPTWREVIMEV